MMISGFHKIWSVPLERHGQFLAGLFFLLLFPAFFFYHYATSAGYIPRFLPGWFGAIALFCVGFMAPIFLFGLLRLRAPSLYYIGMFFALLAMVLCWLLIHMVLGEYYQRQLEALSSLASLLIYWGSLFLIGFYWAKPSLKFKIVLWILFILMGITVLFNVNPQTMIFYGQHTFTNISDQAASYQGYARSFAVTAFFLIVFTDNIKFRFMTILFTVPVLFFIGARSELYAFIIMIPVMLWVFFRGRALPLFWIFVFFSTVSSYLVIENLELLKASRQLRLFDLSADASYQTRDEFLREGLRDIADNPVLGHFAGQIRINDSTGTYIHNALSAWRQFGMVGFMLYVGLFVVGCWISFRKILKTGFDEPVWVLAFLLASFFLVMVVAAKPVFWAPVGLAWGLVAGAMAKEKILSCQLPKRSQAEQKDIKYSPRNG